MGLQRLKNVDMTNLYSTALPVLEDMDRFRRGSVIFYLCCAVMLVLPAFLAGWGVAWFLNLQITDMQLTKDTYNLYGLVIGIITYIGLLIGTYQILNQDYRKRCKRKFNHRLTKVLGLRYMPFGNFEPGAFYPHYILPPFSRAVAEDHLSFTYEKRKIEIQEARFFYYTPDKRYFNRPAYHGRRGLMVRVQSRRYFATHTVVVPKRMVASDRDRARFMGLVDYENIPFGNHHFKRKYHVMAENAVNAHMIFDHAFIERIFAFEKALGARSLSFSFMAGEIAFYAEHAHDFLETGNMFTTIDFATVDRILDELRHLTDIIEHLELDEFTGV